MKQSQLLAALTPLAALALQWLLWPWLQPFIWFLFYPAIFVAARLGGRRSAWLATALSIVLVWYFFAPPQLSFAIGETNVLLSMLVFAAMGALFGEMQEQLLRAQQRDRSALVSTSAKLAAIVESSEDAIIGKTLDGVITSWNRGAQKMFGYSAHEAVGQSITFIIPDDLGHEVTPILASIARGESIRLVETRRRHQDGHLLDVNATITPIRNSEGQIVGAAEIARDIGERKRLDAELKRHRNHLEKLVDERTRELQVAVQARTDAEEFFVAMADNLPASITYWDPDLRCHFVNRRACEALGLPREAILGHSQAELIGEDQAREIELHARAALDGQESQFERSAHNTSGEPVTRWVHFMPDVQAGAIRGVLALATDITPMKKAEARLVALNRELALARDNAEAANRAKSAFLANMSHEIRTPMNAIVGLSQVLLHTSADTQQREQLAKVVSSAEHLLGIVNDVLDLSKIGAGKLQLETVHFDLDRLLARTLSQVSSPARAKGLELVLDTAHLPRVLRGDPIRLAQCLLNLLTNAVKFTEQGSVTLRGELLDESDTGLHVRFSVEDTGIGVPADKVPGLFMAFEQGDTSTTRRHGGTGLGLALTRHLARLMGGESGVQGAPAGGSIFWFTARFAATSAAQRRRPAALQGQRVLLVDDLTVARKALTEMLRALGLRVDAVDSGRQALSALAADTNDPYQLVVLDSQMPGLDGIETAHRLAGQRPARLPSMLMVSTHNDTGLQELARHAGIGTVLVKPVTLSSLHDAVTGLLQVDVPVVKPAPAVSVQELQSALRHSYAGATVLVVEDNPINQEVAVALLKHAGLHADVASDGAEALAMAQRTDYRLILMDMQMPVMDGLQATRAIRAMPWGGTLPIVAITANAYSEDRKACLEAGMNDHIGKPVNVKVLYSVLYKWLAVSAAEQSNQAGTPVASAQLAASDAPAGFQTSDFSPLDTLDIDARLAGVAGLDVATGLRQVGGRMSTFVRIARQFTVHYRGGITGLHQALLSGDGATARNAVHGFKGASATIGASALARQAAALEHDILARRPTVELIDAVELLQHELVRLVSTLSAALPPDPWS